MVGNPVLQGFMRLQDGMPIVVNPTLTVRHFDWSKCRSPSRARRRHRKGHPQRVTVTWKPLAFVMEGVLHMHPEAHAALMDTLDRAND